MRDVEGRYSDEVLLPILARWLETSADVGLKITPVRGGLSGAGVWRIELAERSLCLRRWPPQGPSERELTAIHSLISHVARQGLDLVPVPLSHREGRTIQVDHGALWELAPWLPGEPNYRLSPTPEKRRSAMLTLARFHHVAESHSLPAGTTAKGRSPGLLERQRILHDFQQDLADRLRREISLTFASPERDVALQVLNDMRRLLPQAVGALQAVVDVPLSIQWCLRDIHQGNLLFTGDSVTGLVDFGAATVDSVAGDVARLTASLSGCDREVWQECLAYYANSRALTPAEMSAIEVFDRAGTIAAAANWLRWIYLDRQFSPQSEAAQQRLAELALRLRTS
jgi:Ser/Thr protein kinase RdoA (MazF antagonist)